MVSQAKIIEIFSSIQGEGLWVGLPQTFVRFKGCRLKCTYCDTPLTHMAIQESRVEFPPYSKNFEKHPLEFSIDDINKQLQRLKIPSIAVTGGEPLEQVDFLKEWFPSLKKLGYTILLETSGVEVKALEQVINWIDIVSLDVKIPSATGESSLWDMHESFIRIAMSRPAYAKIVFNEKMTDEEKGKILLLMEKFPQLNFIFQPVSPLAHRDMKNILELFSYFSNRHPAQVRLIPQTHKFLGVS